MLALVIGQQGWPANESRNAILVVAVLIATTTYQATLTPSNLVDPEYYQSPDNIFIAGANATTGAINATFAAANFNTTTTEDYWGKMFPVTWMPRGNITVLSFYFQVFNVMAFQTSMLEIGRNVPVGTAVNLVYPLTVCFMLLMLIVFFIYPIIIASVVYGARVRSRSSAPLGIIFKHYRSFCKEMMSLD